MYSVRGGELAQRDAELIILRVAVHMEAWYEWAAHVDRGLACGLSLPEIYRVAEGPAASEWSKQDQLLLLAVDQLVTRHAIDRETRERLAKYFSERQILDIVSLQGLYVTIACIIGTWPIEIESRIAARLPKEVSEESFRALLLAANSN